MPHRCGVSHQLRRRRARPHGAGPVRQRHHDGLTDLLTQTLLLAAELGMVSLGVVAFDGMRIAANASKAANHDDAHPRTLAEQYLAAVAATDAADDALIGEHARGDQLPAAVGARGGRRERIDAALAQVIARREAEDVERQRAEQALSGSRIWPWPLLSGFKLRARTR